jgi:transcriptional regulator with XRE-family HTH domain
MLTYLHILKGPVMTIFGNRLRDIRTRKGWSVRELSRLAQVPHETISRLENSQQRYPSLPVAKRLAEALGVTLDYLAGMYEDKQNETETTGTQRKTRRDS